MTGSSAPFRALAIAGGSGSGKTTLATQLHLALGSERSVIFYQDAYYRDQSAKFDGDGGSVNFDHPSSLDFDLCAKHLGELIMGRTIQKPIYDFATHKRKTETIMFQPKPLIIVDGTLILHAAKLRPLFWKSIFVETSEEDRFARRLERDVRERGRSPEGVKKQFDLQVKPMHDQFVEPSKDFADLVIPGTLPTRDALTIVLQMVPASL